MDRLIRSRHIKAAAFVVAALGASWTPGGAADLTIGIRDPSTGIDPHWMTLPANFQVNAMIFEPMVIRGNDGAPHPLLAISWEHPDDLTWVFRLRKDVKWHDGSPFTAEDIKFTYSRASNVPNSPTSFSTYLNQIAQTEVVDPYTVKITTREPAPSLLDKLAYILIVSKKHGETATTADYNSGKATIGTGPYRFGSWTPNDRTVLRRNPDYWGARQPWDNVAYRIMVNDSTRLAALLAGDVDVMDTVPSLEIERLKNNPQIALWGSLTPKITAIGIDVESALQSGKVTGPNGEKLDRNPLADARVRQALAIALDRDALIRRFYQGEALATPQFVPEGRNGYNPDIKLAKGDIDAAKKLLEEAGWAGRFKLEVTTAPTFFEQAAGVSEAIAQTWTRAGVQTSVQSVPYPVILKERVENKTVVVISAYMNSTGTADNYFPPIVHSVDPAKGYGNLNLMRYSNKEVDALIEKGMSTMDDAARSKLFADAAKLTIADAKLIPLWFSRAVHASKKGIEMDTRVDFQVLATNIRPAGGAAAAK